MVVSANSDRYVVGVDFGTLSGRALVVRVSDGAELGTAVHEYRHGGDGARAGRDGRAAAAGLGAAGSGRLRRVLRTAVPAAIKNGRRRPGRGDRHRHRLHRVHGAARHVGRDAAVPAAGPGGPPARLPQALEAPRRAGARRPDQRAGPRARASRGSPGTAARSPPSGSSPRGCSCWRRTRRSTRGPTAGSRPPTGSSGSSAATETRNACTAGLQGHLAGRALPVAGVPGRAQPGLRRVRRGQAGPPGRRARGPRPGR